MKLLRGLAAIVSLGSLFSLVMTLLRRGGVDADSFLGVVGLSVMTVWTMVYALTGRGFKLRSNARQRHE